MYIRPMYGLLLTTLSVSVWASAVQKRSIDVDGDGIADTCFEICEKPLTCLLADGSWTTIARDIVLHTTTGTSIAPTTSTPSITATGTAAQSRLSSITATAAVSAVEKDVSQTSSSSDTSSTTKPSSTTKTTTSSERSTTLKTTTTTTKKSSTTKTSTTTSKKTTTAKPTTTKKTTTSHKSSTTKTTTHKSTTTHKTTSASKTSSRTPVTVASPTATSGLPSPSQFPKDNGTKWNIDYVGNISFTGLLQKESLGGDKCRSSTLGDKVIWSCGDMMCGGDVMLCGLSMGPAFYGTDSVMTINTTGLTFVTENDFLQPWSGDKDIQPPYGAWGMDTSNVAAINSTHGVAYGYEIWRNGPDGSALNRGNAVAAITLNATKPIATRVGPLLTDNTTIALGLMAILRDGNYIYIYSMGGPSNIIVGRVEASDAVFTASNYEFLKNGTNDTWVPGIPLNTATNVALATSDGSFFCDNYGSVTFNHYLNKYILLCGKFISFVTMYVSDTPYGPFSAGYQLMSGGHQMVEGSYGPMMHPMFQPVKGSDKSWYFSLGPNSVFYMYKITFDY